MVMNNRNLQLWNDVCENFPNVDMNRIRSDRTYDLLFNEKPSIDCKKIPNIMDTLRKNGIIR